MYSPEEQLQFAQRTKSFLTMAKLPLSDYQTLVDLIRYHEWKYYVQHDPIISDFEYDTLYGLLIKLESEHPEMISSDSPSQRVSSDLTEGFTTVEHMLPMLSLDNSYNAEDLSDFDRRVKELSKLEPNTKVDYFVEPKFDGGSVSFIYEQDKFVRAATRGDGIRGEEITANAKVIKSLPLQAKFSQYGIGKVELRGEVLIRKDVFESINEERGKQGLALFANARNASTGGLRTKDPKETARRKLDVFIFQMAYVENTVGIDITDTFETHEELVALLSKLAFKNSYSEGKLCHGIEEVTAFTAEWAAKREDYAYEIDGMVIKVNNIALQKLCGYTAHHPRFAIAYKFQAKQATSTLLHVDFQVGKIGSVTPVAKIEPVQLAGVTVSSISLHNEEFITSKDIRLGDKVLVERAGDVIPYIVKSFPELRIGNEQQIAFPTHCPVCNTELHKAEGESAWRCPNLQCEAQVVQRIIHHVSKDAMDIDGFGKSNVERFNEIGWLQDMSDVYNLNYDAIAQLDGLGEKSAQKLKLSIEKAKQNPIHRLIHGLCIHHVGKKVSKLLAEQLDYVPNLVHWKLEQFTAIKDVGPVVGENVISFFAKEENRKMIKRMEEQGVNMYQKEEDKPKQVSEDAVFAGKTILFTGTLSKLGRKEAQEMAEAAGAKNISAVSSNLNYLVVGSDAGSKLAKAQTLGTVIILTEDAFLELLGKSNS